MRRASILLAGILLAAGASAAAAQQLGRLFFTPEQRAELDARRTARVPDKPAVTAVESPRTRLDGYVKRSNGGSTVWLNGQPVPVGTGSNEAQIHSSRSRPDTVTVEAADGKKRRISLRVGETLERDTGEVTDVLGGGSVKVSPPPGGH